MRRFIVIKVAHRAEIAAVYADIRACRAVMAAPALILIAAAFAGVTAGWACRIDVAVAAGVAVTTPAFRTVNTHVAASRADRSAVSAEVTVFALFNRFTFKTGVAAVGAGSAAVTVCAGVASGAPAVRRAVYAHVAAPRADCCAVGAEVAVGALLDRFTFQAAVAAVEACSAAVAVRAGVASGAPAVRRTFHADFAAVGAQQHAIGAGVAFRALRIDFAQCAGVVAGFADGVTVTFGTGIAVFAKAVRAVDADFAAFFTNRCALLAGVAVVALTVFVAFHAGFAAVGAGGMTVAVAAKPAALAPVLRAVLTNFVAAQAQNGAILASVALAALRHIFAFKA